MSYPSTVDSGGVSPLIICTDIISLQGVATTALTGNAVYLFAFELQAQTTFTVATWRVGATIGGTSDLGVYTFAGALIDHTGAITNVASTTMTHVFTLGNLTLGAGQYFLAYCVSNSTDTIFSEAIGNLAQISHYRQATNTATAGVLPPTTGGYSDVPARFPAIGLVVSGGLT